MPNEGRISCSMQMTWKIGKNKKDREKKTP